jgi:hypothetical protein
VRPSSYKSLNTAVVLRPDWQKFFTVESSPYRFTMSLVDQLMELQQLDYPRVARVVISCEAGGWLRRCHGGFR